jgi:hypothetical protein
MRTTISQSQEFRFSRGRRKDLRNLLNHSACNSHMSADIVKEVYMLGLRNTYWPN